MLFVFKQKSNLLSSVVDKGTEVMVRDQIWVEDQEFDIARALDCSSASPSF